MQRSSEEKYYNAGSVKRDEPAAKLALRHELQASLEHITTAIIFQTCRILSWGGELPYLA